MLIIVKSGWWEHRGSLCTYQNDTPSTLVGGYILLYIFETSHNNFFLILEHWKHKLKLDAKNLAMDKVFF